MWWKKKYMYRRTTLINKKYIFRLIFVFFFMNNYMKKFNSLPWNNEITNKDQWSEITEF